MFWSLEAAESSRDALRNVLDLGIDRGVFVQRSLTDLIVNLAGVASGFKAFIEIVTGNCRLSLWADKQANEHC